ncbi:MAG: hypothetical protein E7388_06865 [Ruminococcaceae bacterium]|nr:hypothetical protein [Oscillospiraceae bacterium]
MTNIEYKILLTKIKTLGRYQIYVSGMSMFPCLLPNDLITIESQDEYNIGNVVVFLYKHGEILVHRIVKKNNYTIFCKGDNSFRLEDIQESQIVGKVISYCRNGLNCLIKAADEEFINMSYRVGQEFRKVGYDKEKLMLTKNYIKYYYRYIKID